MSPSLRELLPQRGDQAIIAKTAHPVVKPAPKPVAKPSTPAKENRLVRWYRETESELRKVVWPTRQEWTNLTLIVAATTLVTSMFLGMVDFIFERLILLIR